ncbi:DNA-processing protein DprA [Patescibacteria group bacterium]
MNQKQEIKCLHALQVAFSHRIVLVHRLLEQHGSAVKAWQHAKSTPSFPAYLDVRLEWDKLTTLQQETGLQLVQRDDEVYSPWLSEIAQPPHLLYCRGNIDLLKADALVAIVGTRKATTYGRRVVEDCVPELVAAGVVTVSGLALGIDAAVHAATVKAGGQTIAVLGSSVSLCEIYPRRNQALAEEILAAGGLIISEYPPGSQIYPSLFPERNRIIAGLSQATMVIEAGQKSGALITARLALDANRDVLAVPGSVFSPQSDGANQLIARGATPLLSCRTLFDELEYLMGSAPEACARLATAQLLEDEKSLLGFFSQELMSIDDLVEAAELPVSTITDIVTRLLLKGALRDNGDQQYVKAI